MKRTLRLFALAFLPVAVVAAEPLSPLNLARMPASEIAAAGETTLRGIVTFVSGIETNLFVVAPQEHVNLPGVTVRAVALAQMPRAGDIVQATGSLRQDAGRAALDAVRVEVVRHATLPPARLAKQADFRRGLLHFRRIALEGTVREVQAETTAPRAASLISFEIANYTVIVRVPGRLDPGRFLGEPLRVTGLARNLYGSAGEVLDATLEASGSGDVVFLRPAQVSRMLLLVAVVFGAVLLFVSVVLLTLWLRGRQERRVMALIAAERRRMAADLHDTIEQYLAGANLMAAGVLALENVPDEVKSAMRTLASLLANAKTEVRSAVLNLRSETDANATLETAIAQMLEALAKTGVKTRRCLRGLPEAPSEGLRQDVLLILREAVTNAVKHGQARRIVVTADPKGGAGFVLRVLNDGAPFEVDRALGPETGHYGLSGMRERALRNRLGISWGRRGAWTCLQLESEG